MMKTTFFSVLIFALAGCCRAFGQADPTPVATPADIPMPVVQPSPPAASPTPPAPVQSSPTPAATRARCAKPAETPEPVESDESVLTRLEQDWGEAIVRHDADFLERFESDDYTYTGPDGIVSHKSDEIAGARTGFAQIESFKHRDIKPHVYGDTAVVTGATALKGAAGDTDLSGEFRWTDVFVKRNGQWRVVASQATAISKPGTGD